MRAQGWKCWLVGGLMVVGSALAGCTQQDVHSADSAFHDVAQGTHNVGEHVAKGAKDVGSAIKHEVNKGNKK